MNTRDMWEHQVELLTKHAQTLMKDVEKLEERLEYCEGVVLTLLAALKENGVIALGDGETSYQFD